MIAAVHRASNSSSLGWGLHSYLDSHSTSMRGMVICYFVDEKVETQRGSMICPSLCKTVQSRAGIQSLSSGYLSGHQLRMGWEGRPAYLTLFLADALPLGGASLVAQWWRIRLQCKSHKRLEFDHWVGKIPWRRAWKPTPVFLPGNSLGQRSLEGYSPWCHKELDMTEVT